MFSVISLSLLQFGHQVRLHMLRHITFLGKTLLSVASVVRLNSLMHKHMVYHVVCSWELFTSIFIEASICKCSTPFYILPLTSGIPRFISHNVYLFRIKFWVRILKQIRTKRWFISLMLGTKIWKLSRT